MTYYLRLYRNAIIAATITILVMIAVPSVTTTVVNDLPPAVASVLLGHHGYSVIGLECLALAIGALIVWMLVRDQVDTLIESDMDETAVSVYRDIRDRGIAPAIAQQVVDANANMDQDARAHDWQQANQPSFAAELGYRLGVDGETRKMMREFFHNSGAEADMRRTFSTSLEVTLENGNIHKSHTTDATIEPASRFRPVNPERDPHWTGDVAPELVKAKIFTDWNEASVPNNEVIAPEPTSGTPGVATDDELGDDTPDNESSDDEEEDAEPTECTEPEVAAEPTEGTEPEVLFDDETDLRALELEPDAPGDEEDITLVNDGPCLVESDDEVDQDIREVGTPGSQEVLFSQTIEAVALEPTIVDLEPSDGDELGDVETGDVETGDDTTGLDVATQVDRETEALYASVENDPVIAGLVESMKLTRRLSATDQIRYVYAYYASDQALLVTELREPLAVHVDRFSPTMVPLAVQAGVRRCRTVSWIVDITSSASREADLSAIVWVPVGITRLGDAGNHTAWKLVPVASGSTRSFHVGRDHAALAAVRLERVLGTVYNDCEVGQDGASMFYTIPSLGVTIELNVDSELEPTDEDVIHTDADYVQGPVLPVIYDVPLLADMARTWIGERLGGSTLEVSDWLALVNMITTLIMRIEPVPSRDLLGQWAGPDSERGKDLIAKLERIFGDALSGDASGWMLSNVRCDVLWLQELLSPTETRPDIADLLTHFVINTFRPGYSQSLLSLGALDPRMRSTDGIRLEQIIKDVLDVTLDLLSPGAEGVLREHLNAIAAMLGKEQV
ncbi:hypothetical protein [Ferrimicrobium sp.]|uniref:hypothetical protein n=1 Tax=Ferrimicrobium sp. TaxID=2926050 RepID=UPI002626F8E3|nr:hypothetical protein [Ferrimicrobium sp.]